MVEHTFQIAVSGIAWASIDPSCRLSYSVRLEGTKGGGYSPDTQATHHQLILKDFPIKQKSLKNLALSPGRKLTLQQV